MSRRPVRLVCTLALVATALSVVLGTPVPGGSAQAAPSTTQPSSQQRDTTTRVVVVNHNIERRPGVINTTLRQAHTNGARLITLQEVCWWQARDMAAANPSWTVAWHHDAQAAACKQTSGIVPLNDRGRTDSGLVAIRIGGGTTTTHVFRRQYRHYRAGLACVSWKERNTPVHLCSTHLANLGKKNYYRVRKIQQSQAAEVRGWTNRWVRRGEMVIIAGDFNATPRSRTLSEMYELNGTGRYLEATACPVGVLICRRSRAATYDGLRAKIDYVFFSANRMQPQRPHAIKVVPTLSDHHLLRALAHLDLSTRPRAVASRPR